MYVFLIASSEMASVGSAAFNQTEYFPLISQRWLTGIQASTHSPPSSCQPGLSVRLVGWEVRRGEEVLKGRCDRGNCLMLTPSSIPPPVPNGFHMTDWDNRGFPRLPEHANRKNTGMLFLLGGTSNAKVYRHGDFFNHKIQQE